MSLVFPSFLPNPSQTYITETDPKLAITEFDIGNRQRRKYTVVDERISVSWLFTQLEYDAFCYFVSKVLNNGSLDFNVTIMGLDGLQERSVKLAGGRFSSRYVPHMQYEVSASLVAAAAPTMEPWVFEFLMTPEGSAPDDFTSTSSAIWLYLHHFFGDSTASDEVTEFLSTH